MRRKRPTAYGSLSWPLFIVKVVAPNTEIDGAAQIGGQAELLTELPRSFLVQILRNKPITATKLWITKSANGGASSKVVQYIVEVRAWN